MSSPLPDEFEAIIVAHSSPVGDSLASTNPLRDKKRRVLECSMAFGSLVALSPLLLVIALLVKLTSKGPVLHWSYRVGVDNSIFRMPKFRTMRTDAPIVATHLLSEPGKHLTPIGGFLRKFSLDELPQLIAVLKGDLGFVGPRPALYNQGDLINLRTRHGVHTLVPGITGWAQVNGRDSLTIEKKVEFDRFYLQHRALLFDCKIIALTFVRVIRGDGVKH